LSLHIAADSSTSVQLVVIATQTITHDAYRATAGGNYSCATRLLNAGCRVTSIQRLLGHRRLNSTMIYARVHDRTVAEDYYAAMAQIEKSLDLTAGEAPAAGTGGADAATSAGERVQLLELLNRLAEPQLNPEVRVNLVEQIRHVLAHERPERMENPAGGNKQQRGPP
jgi:Phage integrase family